MSHTHFDAIVLGTGGVGSATLFELAKRGQRVLGLDAHPPGHDRGSSHGETRVIRQAYFEHPDYVPLALAAYEKWNQLERQSHRKLFWQTGLLQAGPANGVVLSGVTESAETHGLDVQHLTAVEAMQRFPQFRIPENMEAVFEKAAGYLLVEPCVRTHIEEAIQSGADWEQQSAIGWSDYGDRVEVQTEHALYTANKLVITAGPWAGTALPRLHDQFTVVAKHLHWLAADKNMSPDTGCPVYLFETDEGIHYGFPSLDGSTVKVAEHSNGLLVEEGVDAFERELDLEDHERVLRFTRGFLNSVRPTTLRFDVCFYTMIPDEHFVVGQHPEHANTFVAAGLSGHGFKFTPVLGQALADLVTEGRTDLPIAFLSPRRFAAE